MTLPADVSRCSGVGSDADGWLKECEDCLRRTSPPIDHPWVSYMQPPPEIGWICPYYIEPEKEQ